MTTFPCFSVTFEACRSRSRIPRDTNQLADKVLEIAIGEDVEPEKPDDGNNHAAVAPERLGGLKELEKRRRKVFRAKPAKSSHRKRQNRDGKNAVLSLEQILFDRRVDSWDDLQWQERSRNGNGPLTFPITVPIALRPRRIDRCTGWYAAMTAIGRADRTERSRWRRNQRCERLVILFSGSISRR